MSATSTEDSKDPKSDKRTRSMSIEDRTMVPEERRLSNVGISLEVDMVERDEKALSVLK